MKKIVRFAIAFVVVALAAFVGGWWMEAGKVTSAQNATAACESKLESASHAAARDQAVLDLYRAQAELLKNNFGNGLGFLTKGRASLATNDPAIGAIDAAITSAKNNDHAAADRVSEAIRAVESAAESGRR